MSQETPAVALGRAAARLAGHPTNLSVWWEVCAALGAAGKQDRAQKAYGELGRAASALGHVGLAVACARALEEAKDTAGAKSLIDLVAADHGRASKKILRTLRSAPPAPPVAEPSLSGVKVTAPEELDAALAVAEKAIRAAAASAKGRAPDTLAPTPLVSVLEPAEVAELCNMMQLRRLEKGALVIDVGQPADALYWIARGSVQVSRGEHVLGELRPNQFFGEIALVGGTVRTARVEAAMTLLLLVIPAEAVEKLAERQPRLAKVLAEYARARLLATVMRTSELFSRMEDGERQKLLPLFETQLFEAGDWIVKRGDLNQSLYVVASGRCQVKDGDKVVSDLHVGDGIGEMSLLARQPATFDVIALERTVALSLTRAKFDEVAVNHPGLLAEVYKLLVQRESANQALVHDASELIV